MNKILALMVACAVLVGCEDTIQQKIVGQWQYEAGNIIEFSRNGTTNRYINGVPSTNEEVRYHLSNRGELVFCFRSKCSSVGKVRMFDNLLIINGNEVYKRYNADAERIFGKDEEEDLFVIEDK